MEYRFIKEKKNSLLGMGLMRLPVNEERNIDFPQTEKMVDIAIKNGITYFDTAYPYHRGESETVIGKILKKYPRDSFTLADKMPIWECKSLDDVKRIFNEQLKKCQVEYFDYYLCHAMNKERFDIYKSLGAFEYLDSLRKEGIIKKLGFSFHDASQNIVEILDYMDFDFVQIQFNYLDYEMQNAKFLYDELTRRNISIVVMEPVRGGMLAKVDSKAENLFKTARPNSSIASWALRYVASYPNIKVILSGMSNEEQLLDNINTFTNYEELTEQERSVIRDAKACILGNEFIPCTGCKYCMPCPFGVNIPAVFSRFNNYGITKNFEVFKKSFNDSTNGPSLCKKCKKCMKECPQHLEIPKLLEKINDLLK